MPVHEVSIGQYQPLMLCNEIVVGLLCLHKAVFRKVLISWLLIAI